MTHWNTASQSIYRDETLVGANHIHVQHVVVIDSEVEPRHIRKYNHLGREKLFSECSEVFFVCFIVSLLYQRDGRQPESFSDGKWRGEAILGLRGVDEVKWPDIS